MPENGLHFAVTKSKGPKAKVDAALQPIEVIVTETEIILKPIYFEYDKSNITQEGAFELDKLVQVMKNNDKILVSDLANFGSEMVKNCYARKKVYFVVFATHC